MNDYYHPTVVLFRAEIYAIDADAIASDIKHLYTAIIKTMEFYGKYKGFELENEIYIERIEFNGYTGFNTDGCWYNLEQVANRSPIWKGSIKTVLKKMEKSIAQNTSTR